MLTALLLLNLPVALAQEGTITPGSGVPDYYLIQPGDTLWDISTRFLGDAYAWPELWSYNEYITNPHWIYPGNRIYFRLGDALNPPSAGVAETPAVVSTTPEPRPVAEAAADACDFPPRFQAAHTAVSLTVPGVIANAEDLGIRGRVYGADEPGLMLGEPSIVYLRLDEGAEPPECGQLLSIFSRQGGRLKGPDGVLGYVYRVLATVQVMRVDGSIITARIRDSYSEVARGDLVGDAVPVEMSVDVINPEDEEAELGATIIARLTEEQRLATNGETVFLDRGMNDGLDVGASLYVVERRDAQNIEGKEDDELPERVVGRVVIVRAEPDFSTGVVVNAARDIQVGQTLTTRPNSR